MITVHGLKNCDACRKARKWLGERGAAHAFHDLRADGLEPETLRRWIAGAGWEALLNRRGTTWRGLPEDDRENVDAATAETLMLRYPALVKRPVIEAGGRVFVGFGDDVQAALSALAAGD